MLNIINVFKPIGFTPYQIVQQVKKFHPELQSEKIGYAGRLDPMAEGVLILLVGEKNKDKIRFEKLDKTYEFEAILGITTDSYDLLGKVQNIPYKVSIVTDRQIQQELDSLLTMHKQYYPPYSSAHVHGKPLFYWARKGLIKNIKIPMKPIQIKTITFEHTKMISSIKLQDIISNRISLVKGTFRQKEILTDWNQFFNTNSYNTFQLIKAKVRCTSGTYVRGLVHELGKRLGTGATTFSIKRTSVGKFTIDESLDIVTESIK